jgi:hypothetical protein
VAFLDQLALVHLGGRRDPQLDRNVTLAAQQLGSSTEVADVGHAAADEGHLAGLMPSLPAQNSALSAALKANRDYMARLFDLSDKLGEWITEAQAKGQLRRDMPAELILYTVFARACDPVLDVMKSSGKHSDEEIVALLLAVHFEGLVAK